MRPSVWILLAVVLYAFIVGATLTFAARGGPRRMWGWAGGIVLIAFALSHAFGAVPIFYVACPLCGYGWDISPFGFVAAAVFSCIALRRTAHLAMPPLVRLAVVSAAALPPLLLTLGWWVS